MDFLIVGTSFKTAPLAVRERIALGPEPLFSALEQVKKEGFLAEALILSTCNRTEFYALRGARAGAARYVGDFMKQKTGSHALADPTVSYVYRDRSAVEHLFRVGAGLDSMVIGETQILGQVKEAYSAACRAGTTGAFLNKLLHMTFRIAKKVRTSTGIGEGSVSVSSVAIQQIAHDLGSLSGRTVLVVGAGRNGEVAAKHLRAGQVAELLVANRTLEKAEELARSTGGKAFSLDKLPWLLSKADAVLTTTSSPSALITRSMMAEAMAARTERPLVIADIGAPRDVDPSVSTLEGVCLHDLDTLERMAERNIERRKHEARKAEALVSQQVSVFLSWYRSLMVKPITLKLEEKMESMRLEELEKLRKRFDDKQLKKIDHFSRILLRRFLQDPLSGIKLCDRSSHVGLMRLDAIRDLFRLDDDEPPT